MTPLPVSLYLVPEWWDRYYHAGAPRPVTASRDGLEAIYLGRQRFLYSWFAAQGLGQECPALGPSQLATVIRYGFDQVPVLLGTRLDLGDAWGFFPRFRELGECQHLVPVDVAQHPLGEWLLREKEQLTARYGGCSHGLDLGSVTNHAFRILGQNLYADLAADPAGVEALGEVILATMERFYAFLRRHFGGGDPVPVSNCNVSLMGPRRYVQHLRAFDARQAQFGGMGRAAVHHCDVPVDSFVDAYAGLPGLVSLQAAITSDVALVKRVLPSVAFSALVSPTLLMGHTAELRRLLDRALAAGVADLALWNIDAATTPESLRAVLKLIAALARKHDRQPAFTAMPLCWEEIEWAHGRYAAAWVGQGLG